MVHQQSKIFYRNGAGKLKNNQCSITDIFLVFLLHSCRISYSAGEPFVPEGIISVPSLIISSGTNGSPAE
jgi:hypothetical protein